MTNKLNVNLPVNGFFINLTNKRVNKQKALDYVVDVAKVLVHPTDFESLDSVKGYSFLEVENGGNAYALHQESSLESSSIDVSFLFLEDEKVTTSETSHDFSNLPENKFYVEISDKLDIDKLYEYLRTLDCSKHLGSLSLFKERQEGSNYIEVSSYDNLIFLKDRRYLEKGSKNITSSFLIKKETTMIELFESLPRKSFYVTSKDRFKTNFDINKFQSFLDFLGLKLQRFNSVKEAVDSNKVTTIEVDHDSDGYYLSEYSSRLLDSRSVDITKHFLLEDTFKLPLSGKYRINSNTADEAYQILSYLESKDFRWQSGHLPTKWRSMDYLASEDFGFDVEEKEIWCNADSHITDLTNDFFAHFREEETKKPVYEFPNEGTTFINISSEKEAAQLLNYLKCMGYLWQSGSKPTEFQSTSYFVGKYIRINHDTGQLALAYGRASSQYEEESKKFFEFISNKANLIPDEEHFYVLCKSKAEADILLEALEAKGITWHSGNRPTQLPTKYFNLTYGVVRRCGELSLGYGISEDPGLNLTDLFLGDVRLLNKESTKKQNKTVSDTTKELQDIADALPSKWYVVNSEINTELLIQVCEYLDIDFQNGDIVRESFENQDINTGQILEYGSCICKEGLVVVDDIDGVDSDSEDITHLFRELTLTKLSKDIHKANVERGWYKNSREDGTLIMLAVSELAEAMEGNRKDLMDDHLPHRKMEEVELADAVIRILDYSAYKGYDIGKALEEKLEYNKTRADHDLSERAKQSGKRY